MPKPPPTPHPLDAWLMTQGIPTERLVDAVRVLRGTPNSPSYSTVRNYLKGRVRMPPEFELSALEALKIMVGRLISGWPPPLHILPHCSTRPEVESTAKPVRITHRECPGECPVIRPPAVFERRTILRKGPTADEGIDPALLSPAPATVTAETYAKAVALVGESRSVTLSHLQRHLGVGYRQAAQLMERMEKEGIINPTNGGAPW